MLPASNTELELIAQLSSDKKSLRMNAITKLARIGSSQESLQALTPFLTQGSREEALYATQAIGKISKKLGISMPNEGVSSPVLNSDPSNRVPTSKEFLDAKRHDAPRLLQYIRSSNNISEDLLPSIGVFLGKFGDKSDAQFIQKYLKQHNDNLTLPYISAAEKIDLTILVPVLPYLLASSEALVRSRAVRALQRIDPEEAERHFLRILASKKAEDRLSALEISFLFPFDRVKDYILALLAEEKDPDVLKACATVLASNPSQEIALRILDIVESQPLTQRKTATTIFNIVVAAISSAKILPPEKATPQALVNSWKEQRLQNFLKDLEIQLSATTGQKREAIVVWLEKNSNIKQVSDFIESLALNPQAEDVYQRLSNSNANQSTKTAQSSSENPSAAEQSKPANPTNPALNGEKAQIRYLKKLGIEEFVDEKNKIFELAESPTVSAALRAEALNTLLRLSPNTKIKQYGLKALAEKDSKLKTAGFKILERVAPDVLKEQLSDLLLSSDDTIRIRAIRFGLKIDQQKSIEALEKLIKSPDQNNRSNAVNCLALCPFDEVYSILIKALQREKHPLVAKQIISIFISNPDPVILSMLDKISVITKDPSLEMIIQQARSELEELLASLPTDSKKSSLTEIDLFESNLPKHEDKPYSVENVRKLTAPTKVKATPKKEANSFLASIQENKAFFFGLIAFVVLTTVSVIAFISDKENGIGNMSKYQLDNRKNKTNERSIKRQSRKIPTSLTMHKTCHITGTITEMQAGGIFLKYEKRELYIKFQGKEAKGLKKGDTVTVKCIPYKENPSGTILANGKEVKKK